MNQTIYKPVNRLYKIFSQMMLLLMLTVGMSSAFAAQDPTQLLRSVTDQMLAALKQDKAKIHADPTYVYTLVDRIVVPHADFAEMSKRVLGVNWRNATSEQRSRFQAEFTTLVIRTYATAFNHYRDERVEIVGERKGQDPKLVEIKTLVKQTSGPDIPVNYRLLSNGSTWKVYDMNIDGVSLVSNFRAQFSSTIRQKGLDELIAELKERNAKGTNS